MVVCKWRAGGVDYFQTPPAPVNVPYDLPGQT
jgi:hypothetical protein